MGCCVPRNLPSHARADCHPGFVRPDGWDWSTICHGNLSFPSQNVTLKEIVNLYLEEIPVHMENNLTSINLEFRIYILRCIYVDELFPRTIVL